MLSNSLFLAAEHRKEMKGAEFSVRGIRSSREGNQTPADQWQSRRPDTMAARPAAGLVLSQHTHAESGCEMNERGKRGTDRKSVV